MHAGHVSAESIVMAFKQESYCLHKSSGSEEEGLTACAPAAPKHTYLQKTHDMGLIFAKQSYLFNIYLALRWSNRKERRQLEGLATSLLSTIKQISGHGE